MPRHSKVTLRLSPAHGSELRRLLPWGARDAIYRRFTDALLAAVDAAGPELVKGIASGRVAVRFEEPAP